MLKTWDLSKHWCTMHQGGQHPVMANTSLSLALSSSQTLASFSPWCSPAEASHYTADATSPYAVEACSLLVVLVTRAACWSSSVHSGLLAWLSLVSGHTALTAWKGRTSSTLTYISNISCESSHQHWVFMYTHHKRKCKVHIPSSHFDVVFRGCLVPDFQTQVKLSRVQFHNMMS